MAVRCCPRLLLQPLVRSVDLLSLEARPYYCCSSPPQALRYVPRQSTDLLRGGVVPSEIYSDEELHQKEQDTKFTRFWLFIGHGSMVPNSGDYIASYMGEDSVSVIRDAAP